MRFMVTISPKSDRLDTLRELMPAELAHVAKLRQAGVIHEVYPNSLGRAWVVAEAGSTDEVQRVLAELPFYPHVDMSVEPLLDRTGPSVTAASEPKE
jgi:muconolactone delta-isomerase